MDIRLRLFIILLVGLIAAAVWTFPEWWPYLRPGEVVLNVFPGLSQEKQARFLNLRNNPNTSERAEAYLDLYDEDPAMALALIDAYLEPVEAVALSPELQSELEALPVLRSGTFINMEDTPYVYESQGTATIYQRPDGSRILVLSNDFRVTNGPALKVVFSRDPAPMTSAQVGVDYIEAVPSDLQSPIGGQVYELVEGVDLDEYQSVVIFSPDYDLVFGTAPLR